MEYGYLDNHHHTQNVTGRTLQWEEAPEEAQYYRVSFLMMMEAIACPVPVCEGGEINRTNLRIHFVHRHMQDTLWILEEGNHTHPQ